LGTNNLSVAYLRQQIALQENALQQALASQQTPNPLLHYFAIACHSSTTDNTGIEHVIKINKSAYYKLMCVGTILNLYV
jgi:hypothetical protein